MSRTTYRQLATRQSMRPSMLGLRGRKRTASSVIRKALRTRKAYA